MKCKHGCIVEDVVKLKTKRNLKCSISLKMAFEAAEDGDFSECRRSRTLQFNELFSTIGMKIENKYTQGVGDRDIACALYVASSCFSVDEPKAGETKDYVWGDRDTERKECCNIIRWVPEWMRILRMAGWK